MRRLGWQPPKNGDIQRTASFATYKNQSRVLGDASAEEISSMTESLTNGPSPAPNPVVQESPVKLNRATRFFSRGKQISKPEAHISVPNLGVTAALPPKPANQHWYSALLRRGTPSRMDLRTHSVEPLPFSTSISELEDTSYVPELGADQQQPSELPARPSHSPNQDTEVTQVVDLSARSDSTSEPSLMYQDHSKDSAPQQPLHMPIPRVIRRPPTYDYETQIVRSVSPVDTAMSIRTMSTISRAAPSRSSTSNTKQGNTATKDIWD